MALTVKKLFPGGSVVGGENDVDFDNEARPADEAG